MRIFPKRDLSWKDDRLYVNNRSTGFSVARDEKYPDIMWRVRYPGGALSDMVNRTRAKDAAMSRALAVLNRQEPPSPALPIDLNGTP